MMQQNASIKHMLGIGYSISVLYETWNAPPAVVPIHQTMCLNFWNTVIVKHLCEYRRDRPKREEDILFLVAKPPKSQIN